MCLDLIKQHTFHLDLENNVIKTSRDEIAVKMIEQGLSSRKVMLQGNELLRFMEDGLGKFKSDTCLH